jgi:hypothetical protein
MECGDLSPLSTGQFIAPPRPPQKLGQVKNVISVTGLLRAFGPKAGLETCGTAKPRNISYPKFRS